MFLNKIMIYTIYCATNIITGKQYIGFTSQDLSQRKRHHKYQAFTMKEKFAFANTIRKHGWEQFQWQIIYQSQNRKHTLTIMEPFFIKEYNTQTPNGYNITLGGEGSFGCKNPKPPRSLQHRENIRKAHLGQKRAPFSEETRRRMSLGQQRRRLKK